MSDSLVDLRAIARGADPILVECVGAVSLTQLMDEGANIQALKLKMSEPMKAAKHNMKRAKTLARDGKNVEAKQAYDTAIKNLKELQKAAEEIDDDHIVMVAVDALSSLLCRSLRVWSAVISVVCPRCSTSLLQLIRS